MLSVIILTYNESLHIKRCLESLQAIAEEVFVVDSYSTDDTVNIAKAMGAKVYQNTWINYATQFQWGLDNCPISTTWVMRMDADEYVLPELANEIKFKLPSIAKSVSGIVLNRRLYFMDSWIRYGGYYPIKLLRIWRTGYGTVEQRWMDEHIKLSFGQTVEFDHDFVDENLNNLTWWTQKHNSYAVREVIDLLNAKHNLFHQETIEGNNQDARKRWYKDNLYARSPLFVRAIAYFLYRYVLQLGFLDGKPGFVWHSLQGLWYRFLVDAKIWQIESTARKDKRVVSEILEEEYGVKL